MFWMTQRTMERRAGNPETIVFLADKSSSMYCAEYSQFVAIQETIDRYRAAFPTMRTYAFYANVIETTNGRLETAAPSAGFTKSLGRYTNCTYLSPALAIAERLSPCRTIVVSDGGIVPSDMAKAMRIADRMTGSIDAYFCPSDWADAQFMGELARRGRGELVWCHQETTVRQHLTRTFEVLTGPMLQREHMQPEYVSASGDACAMRVIAKPSKITVRRG